MNTREITVKLLRSYEENDSYVNLSLNSPLISSLSSEDRSFVTALLYTTVERRITIDYYISALAKRRISDISPKALALLRIGIAQLLFMEGVKEYAAVSETVALAKGACFAPLFGKRTSFLCRREKKILRAIFPCVIACRLHFQNI